MEPLAEGWDNTVFLLDGTWVCRFPRRQLAAPEPPLRLGEEEVPREGAMVERAFRYARWVDGRSLTWLGRRKYGGRGESSSGLRFDSLRRDGG